MQISKARTLLSFLIVLHPLFSFAESDGENTLTVIVDGASTNEGQVILSIFDSEADFLKNPMLDAVQKVGDDGKAHFSILGIRDGKYAISVVYDEDSNGELNSGFMGIPTELFGFSNNARGFIGPPSFKKAMFEIQASMELSIRLGEAKK